MSNVIRATGLYLFNPEMEDCFDHGPIMKHLKNKGTSHRSSDFVEGLCEDGCLPLKTDL